MLEHHTVEFEDNDGKVLVNQSAGSGDDTNKSKKRTRDFGAMAKDECHITVLEKAHKRIILSLTKPSYLLGLGSNNVRPENRVRLCQLLQKLVRQHNWTEASGVLSILLKGTCKDKSPTMNRFKYLVSMECLKHIEYNNANLTAIDNIYDTWMTRIGINLSNKRKKNGSMIEDSFVVRLESILFRFMQGNIEGERQNARSLMQEHELKGYPIFNVIAGLIFYQLFYSSIPEDMQWKDSDQIYSPSYSDMSAVASQFDMSATKFRYEAGSSKGRNPLLTDESESSFQYGSESSVMNNKEMPVKSYGDFHNEVGPMEVDVNLQTNLPQGFQPQGFYVNSAENGASVDNSGGHLHSVSNLFAQKSLDSWLLPLRTGDWEMERVLQDYEYKHAVRYLQEAVYSNPPSLAALLPLIQLLLIGCQYKEAMQELEKFCNISNAALPTRLRAHLLERVDPNNNILLPTSYEETLKSDPTCSTALARLISLHQNGNYGSESLLEMIALHLDAVFVEYTIWREFALCFIKVSQYEEDCMSICLPESEGGKMQGYSVRYSKIPKLFIHGKSGKGWKVRCRWWLTRHFSRNQLTSEIASGDLELLAYKAACASHIYGPDFDYVVKAHTFIEKENDRDLFMFLQFHLKNSVGFYSYFQQRTS